MPGGNTTITGVSTTQSTAAEDQLRQLILSRFSYGQTPELVADVVAAGGALAWFDQQLDHLNVPDPAGDAVLDFVPGYAMSPTQVKAAYPAIDPAVEAQLVGYNFWRRVRSSRQVFEVMHDFWRNTFYTTISENKQMLYFQGDFDRTVRSNALGSYVDLVKAVETHGLMLLYLDCINQPPTSTPNENLAREMLELHTVGLGNFGESDVKDLAKLLTGWWHQNTGYLEYDQYTHARGPLSIIGWTDPNADYDGRALIPAFLDYLAKRPATLRTTVKKLAVKFVGESPSQALLDALYTSFSTSGYSIKETLRTLVRHPEFQQSGAAKVKTPQEELIHVMRVVTKDFTGNQEFDSTTYQIPWSLDSVGNLPYGWPMPNGYSTKNATWSSAQRLLWSAEMHFQLPQDTWIFSGTPRSGLQLKTPAELFAPQPCTMLELVRYLAVTITGLALTPAQRDTSVAIAQIPRARTVTPESFTQSQWAWTLATILDSPQFMTK